MLNHMEAHRRFHMSQDALDAEDRAVGEDELCKLAARRDMARFALCVAVGSVDAEDRYIAVADLPDRPADCPCP